jgi:hypothetical protein
MIDTKISEIVFPFGSKSVSFHINECIGEEIIKEIKPMYDINGALICVQLIGYEENILTTIYLYGIPCFIA